MSDSHKGKIRKQFSDETKEKMRIAHLKNNKQLTLCDDIIIHSILY